MGETWKECPGCGEKGRRTRDKVCSACERLLAIGRAVKDEDLKKADKGATFRLSASWPSIYSPGGDPGDRSLEKAFQEVAQAALKRLKSKVDPYQKDGEALPPASNSVHYNSHDIGASLWTGSRRLADALTALDTAVRQAILDAYKSGEEAGADLLLRLAGGHVSVNDLTEAQIEAGRKK